MADYDAHFEGMDKLIKRINRIGKLTEVKNIVRKRTVATARESQKLVPVGWGKRYAVRTPEPKGYRGGTLKRSMKQQISSAGLTGEVSYNTDYAAYQEYGTRFIPARKYLGKPFLSEKVKFINDLKGLVK